jgi:UDP-N-acetylmuramoyl-tripeptide--D-alanyl-D-alanine ligase
MGSPDGCPVESGAREVTSFVVDSREAATGVLFVALPGERTDGHLYLADAFARGALAAIATPLSHTLGLNVAVAEDGRFTPAPDGATAPIVFVVPDSLAGLQRLAAFWRAKMPVIAVGITGSIGKTTTKEIVTNVLAQRYHTLHSEGNLNNEIGLPLTLLQLTPAHERVVLEMGMYALGEITQLCALAQPRVGIVTNVGPTHLERLGTIERIAEAKAELVRALPPAADGGVAILNADDARVRAMAGLTSARVVTYGLNPAADLYADDIESDGLDGIRFHLHDTASGEAFYLRLPMLGRHSVHTALRAAAAGRVDDLAWPEVIAGLETLGGQLRLMVTPGLRDTLLIDDTYNASPESMMAALNLLEDIARERGAEPHRAVAVLGDMLELGSYEETGHRLVGGRAAQVVDAGFAGKLVTVGPRGRWIADEAVAVGMPAADVHSAANNLDAVAILQGIIRAGDVILIKGSRAAGMEAIVDALSRPSFSGQGQ